MTDRTRTAGYLRRLLPLLVLGLILAFFYAGFELKDARLLPSALVGQSFPAFSLPRLHDGDVLATERDLIGAVSLVNVWATWCPSCAAEHSTLSDIVRTTGIVLIGINYKDDAAKARQWLRERGDPYRFHIVDASGDLGVELGVYGAPETFVVDADGVVRHRFVGEVTERVWREELSPVVESLGGVDATHAEGPDAAMKDAAMNVGAGM